MRVERIRPGSPAPVDLEGSVLTRDLTVAGQRWSKGRRLTAADLERLARGPAGPEVSLLVPDAGDLHEDEAALRLAEAVCGPNLTMRGPVQSRVDLLAVADGVLHVRTGVLDRINRIDPLEVFTAYDGSIVRSGDLVASVKVAPHLVPETVVEAGVRRARSGAGPVVRIASFLALRVGVIVRESIRAAARDRFEASVRAKIEGLGSALASLIYVDDDGAVTDALRRLTSGRDRVDLVLTAGGGSTDPADPFFTGIEALGGRIVRHGVPAHPGSMLWLGRLGRTAVLGLPSCGAYSKATAADLVLPRLLTGERPRPALVSSLGHGGILTRDQRFRFPSYARDLDAPDG